MAGKCGNKKWRSGGDGDSCLQHIIIFTVSAMWPELATACNRAFYQMKGNLGRKKFEAPVKDVSVAGDNKMPVPETTSAEAFERYVGGKVLRACRGEAWRDIKAWIIAPPRNVEMVPLPAVSEPFLAWSVSGEAEFQEREGNRPWITHHIKRGSFFLTAVGGPSDWRRERAGC